MDSPNPVRISEDRLLVKTSCHLCFVDVEHSRQHEDIQWIALALLSTHVGWWNGRLRSRIADAWRGLRNIGYPYIELNCAEEADALIEALTIARKEAFGSD